MPCLHSASVPTRVPSTSRIASLKKAEGCWAQTRSRVSIDGVHQGDDVGLGEAAAEVACGGGVGDALGAQGIEVDLVVAPQFEVLDPFAAGEDVEGDVQDVVGFVVGEMSFEEMEVAVDVADQADPLRQQEHGADAAGGEALDAVGEFIVDVGGGHHGLLAFGFGPIRDAFEEPPLAFAEDPAVAFPRHLAVAFSGLLGDSSSHSKTSVVWNSEDVFLPQLFHKLRGFSSFYRDSDTEALNITLGLGLEALTELTRMA